MHLSWKIRKLNLYFLLLFIPTLLYGESAVADGFLLLGKPNKLYHLTGTWLHQKEIESHKHPDPSHGDWLPIPVPGIWSNIGIQHKGNIWYKLDFRIYGELREKELGLMIPNTALCHELYINGKLLDGSGVFDSDGSILAKSTKMNFYTLPRSLILPKGKNTILIRVGSYGGVGGFNSGEIFLGEKTIVQEQFLRFLLWNTILVAVFIFVSVYHIVIYLARKTDREYLYYSLLCFAIAIYNLSFSTLSYWVWDNFWFYFFGTLVSVSLIPVLLVQFFHKFLEYPKKFFAKAIINISFFLLGLGILLCSTSEDNFQRYHTTILPILLVLVAITLVYPLYYLIKGTRQSRIGSWIILIGYSLFSVATLYDVINYLAYIGSPQFIEYGFLAFILSISFAVGMKFANVHNQLEYLTKNLKEEVMIRTREITETNKRLIEMDRLKTSFFANVTHELRTPLTLSILPLERVIQSIQDPDQIQLLETSHRNNIKLLKLINDLLDFARIEAGLMDLRLAPINLTSLVQGLVSHFELSASVKGIQINTNLEENLVCILDPEKTEKILTNLLSNAFKFTPSGGRIYIYLEKINNRGDIPFCKITVGDTGIGIPREQLDYIFERFHQIDMSRERRFEGSGIGLSLVKELTELHNGFVEVNSEVGKGSEFRVFLPMHANPNFPIEKEILPEQNTFSSKYLDALASPKIFYEPQTGTDPETDKPRIVIVEDNEEMLYLLKQILGTDYLIYPAKNPVLGLEVAQRIIPALIISDVMMPEMNGFEFTRKLKEMPGLRSIPIVLLTAMNDLDGKLEGFTSGADDYIAKPFQPLELKARIQNLIVKSNLQKEKNQRLSQLQKELILARDIQSRLLPAKLPSVGGLSFGTLYIPLDEVGGDFYDVYENQDTITVFVCDVSGHGVPACLIASMVKMAFQSEIQENSSLDKVLRGLNRSLYSMIGNNFVTASIAEIHKNTRQVRYVNAGHPPFLHISNSGIIERNAEGKPLGVLSEFEFTVAEFSANEGDSLFFYTDGIPEATGPSGEAYGDERLKNLLGKSKAFLPRELIDALGQELRGFMGEENFEDDITAFVVRFESE